MNIGIKRERKRSQHRSLRRILILCEDEKSSVLYLKRFPVDKDIVQVEYVGTGLNTDGLMQEAIRRKKDAIRADSAYAEIWVVFDRDSFPQRNFDRAFDLASSHQEILACWSNECFELWYLLHFQYQNTGMARERIFDEVGKKIGYIYQKNDGNIFEVLKDKLPTALKNADKLYQHNSTHKSLRENPSTLVHKLVKMLMKLDPSEL